MFEDSSTELGNNAPILWAMGMHLKEVFPLTYNPDEPDLVGFKLIFVGDDNRAKQIIQDFYRESNLELKEELEFDFWIGSYIEAAGDEPEWLNMEQIIDIFHRMTIDWLEERL